ncbi:hypothetical protein OK016_03865 [Vibrio chagasii]|nr:hypothetical protein [Vibrio chagasii]
MLSDTVSPFPLNQPSAEGLIPKPAGEQLYLSILREFIVALLPNDVNPKKEQFLTFYYIVSNEMK